MDKMIIKIISIVISSNSLHAQYVYTQMSENIFFSPTTQEK